HYKSVLRKNGVRVISAKETISDGPEGIILESMLEGYAEYYSAELSQKIIRGMTENALNAKFNGGCKTFGYIIDENKHFQIDPTNAPIVKEIFTRYADGEGTKSILNSLKASGIKNSHGKIPGYNFITTILKNRRYLGEYRFKDTVVENAFEPIVSQELFDKCQKRLEANKKKPAHFKKVEDKYILTGKIFCGLCGNSMIGVSGTSKTGTKHRYYCCRNAKNKKSCSKKRIKKDLLESTVLVSTLEMLKDKKLIKKIVNTCFNMQSNTSSVLKSMENRLKQIEKEISNMIAAIKQGIITESTKTELSSLEAEKNGLQTSIAREQIKHPVLTKEQIEFWIGRFQNTDITDQIQKQKLIDVFINSVYVYEDKIIITFNYKDGEKSIDFSDIEKIAKKKNSDNSNDYQSSPLKVNGGP
ncbi:MAG: recombinase family protein, partial [Clostridia bacterium]|nr:recombinase family protein [Clostridia bacterium]